MRPATARQVLTGRGGPTSDMHIRYLGAATEGTVLRAEARVQRAGRTLIVMDVRVTDQDGRLVAVGDLALAPLPTRRQLASIRPV